MATEPLQVGSPTPGARRILLNTLPILAGGGVQKSITLFRTFDARGMDLSRFTVIARRGTELESEARKAGFDVVVSGPSTAGRLRLELTARRKFRAGSVCFTLSGPPMLSTAGYLLNVVECAYSNLLYPEIDFRKDARGFQWWRRKSADFYRRKALKRADVWIFQTRILADRAVDLVGFPRERVHYVPTAPNSNVTPERVSEHVRDRFDSLIPEGTRLLFLNSPKPNKRVHLFPEVLQQAIAHGLADAIVVTTLPERHPYTVEVRDAFASHGLLDRFHNIGKVPPGDVASCISCCDAVCTLSVLESFSNNYIEAWRMGKPLITTRADWATDVAGDAALFVDVESTEVSGREIAHLMGDPARRKTLVENGYTHLNGFATAESKLDRYLEILDEAEAMGPCPEELRRQIRW